ncbi:RHS repeat-associated core domain-containing protein [Pseudomonas capeferrum]|uniref:RHS repeat-associated core domain-containing protein n=1 Tax=Pseudomonas TaxID=286 RepID=UPI0016453183|nr:RHS repeat-associated core domain-containing protein [Pseudomonas sp. SWRI77]MBC3479486.1 RHS repeat-associated core domain-containing protein [Pseudomonas sp. SWRI77]
MSVRTQYFYQGQHPSVALCSRETFLFVHSGPLPLAECRYAVVSSCTQLLACDGNHSILDRTEHNADPLQPGRYTAYGHDNKALGTRLGFNGQLLNLWGSLYFLGNGTRIYSPSLMRLSTPDSFSPFDAGGFNAYIYCGNDPVNYTDPSGHMRRSRSSSQLNTPRPDRSRSSSPIFAPRSPPSWNRSPSPAPRNEPEGALSAVSRSSASSPHPPQSPPGTPPPIPGHSARNQAPDLAVMPGRYLANPITRDESYALLDWNSGLRTRYARLNVLQSREVREIVISARLNGSSGRAELTARNLNIDRYQMGSIVRAVNQKIRHLRKRASQVRQ